MREICAADASGKSAVEVMKQLLHRHQNRTKKGAKTQWEPIATSRSVNVNRPSEIATNRRACGFYVVNAVSASMFHLCQYLMRDAVFEGKGGRKFVRIQPGSLLELLYPASRHSPDKCIFCGGSYADHMTLWWSKHIYSPYDLYMDRTYAEGVLQEAAVDPNARGRAAQRAALVSTKKKEREDDEPTRRYAFHIRYVHDLSFLLQGTTKPREMLQKLTQLVDNDPYLADFGELRVGAHDTTYVVPSIGSNKNPLLKLARQKALDAVDALMHIEEADNALPQMKAKT